MEMENIRQIVVGKNNMYCNVLGDGPYGSLYKIDLNKKTWKELENCGFSEFGIGNVYFTTNHLLLNNMRTDGNAGGIVVNLKNDKAKHYEFIAVNNENIYYALFDGKYIKAYKTNLDFSNKKYLGEVKDYEYMYTLENLDDNYLYYYSMKVGKTKKIKLRTKAERAKYQVKGLSKEVRKEYVKILRKHIKWANDFVDFGFADINKDGKKDLIVEEHVFHEPEDTNIYINKTNKVLKSVLYGSISKIYKNYILAKGDYLGNLALSYGNTEDIYKIDGKGKIHHMYSYSNQYNYSEPTMYDSSKEENEYDNDVYYNKLVGNKMKKISKKEYEKFASKFKEFKYDLPLKQLTIGNIEKYVSE